MAQATRKGVVKHNRPIRQLLAAAVVVILGLFSAACFPEHPQSTFDAAGPVAKSQLNLFYIIFWVAVFVFVVVEGALVYTTIRFRRKPGQEIPVQTHGNTPLEIAWTIAPAILLAVVAVPTVATIFDNARLPTQENTVHVKVTGHQWWWEFEYFTREEADKEEADLRRVKVGALDRKDAYTAKPYVVTANELHVPVGAPVSLVLESDNVIHSFWVPKLAGKMDVVPNNRNTMWFQADRADSDPSTPEIDPYLGQCAEFCGIAHALMGFRVIAQEQSDFDRWLREHQATPPEPAGLAAEGRQVYLSKGCWACHTVEGVGGKGTRGPNLTHVGSRTTLGAGLVPNDEQHLTDWLLDPLAMKPGNIMGTEGSMFRPGAVRMTDEEIRKLVAYLQSLR